MRNFVFVLGLMLLAAAPPARPEPLPPPAGPDGLVLLMLERPGCVWCARWHAEIGPAWPRTEEGRRAPLRRVDLSEPWPADLAAIAPDTVTPTFVLVRAGREIGRIRGHPGPDFFWPLAAGLLARAGTE